jgi:hypothetical protein
MLYAFLYSVCRVTRTLRSSLSSTVRVPDSPFHLSSSVVSLPFVYIASGLPSSPLLYSVSSTHCPRLCSNRLCSLMYKYFVRWALTAHLDITLILRSNTLALFLSSCTLTSQSLNTQSRPRENLRERTEGWARWGLVLYTPGFGTIQEIHIYYIWNITGTRGNECDNGCNSATVTTIADILSHMSRGVAGTNTSRETNRSWNWRSPDREGRFKLRLSDPLIRGMVNFIWPL